MSTADLPETVARTVEDLPNPPLARRDLRGCSCEEYGTHVLLSR